MDKEAREPAFAVCITVDWFHNRVRPENSSGGREVFRSKPKVPQEELKAQKIRGEIALEEQTQSDLEKEGAKSPRPERLDT